MEARGLEGQLRRSRGGRIGKSCDISWMKPRLVLVEKISNTIDGRRAYSVLVS